MQSEEKLVWPRNGHTESVGLNHKFYYMVKIFQNYLKFSFWSDDKNYDILEMIDMCRDFILDRLHYIDRIFGNENYLKEIEEEILDVAAAKTRMKRFVKIKMVV